MTPLTLPDYIRTVDAQLNATPDLGERGIYLNREIAALERKEDQLGIGLPYIKNALLLRKAWNIEQIRERIRVAESAPSFAHAGEVWG